MCSANMKKCFHKTNLRKIAAAIRVECGRKSVAPHLSRSLVERNHVLDPLFSVKSVVMKEKPRKKDDDHENSEDDVLDEAGYKNIPTVGVFCNDCDEMVQYVLRERGLDPQDCNVLCGFDGGQGILKIGFTIAERASLETEQRRSKYTKVSFVCLSTSFRAGFKNRAFLTYLFPTCIQFW